MIQQLYSKSSRANSNAVSNPESKSGSHARLPMPNICAVSPSWRRVNIERHTCRQINGPCQHPVQGSWRLTLPLTLFTRSTSKESFA